MNEKCFYCKSNKLEAVLDVTFKYPYELGKLNKEIIRRKEVAIFYTSKIKRVYCKDCQKLNLIDDI